MSSRIGAVLQQLGDGADVQLLAPPAAVRARGNRRRRWATIGIAAGVALGCSVLVLVLATLDTSERATQPIKPAPSPSSTPQTGRPDNSSPLHPIATDGHRFSAHAIAARDGRFVIVGDSSDLEMPGPPVYWSDNGVDWYPPSVGSEPVTVNVTDVIAVPEGFLAVGVGSDRSKAWRSKDGRTWVESPVATSSDRGLHGLWGITSTRLGYFAWGFHGSRAQLWRSADGTAWVPVVDESVFDLPRSETICAVRDVEGGLLATGVETPPNSRKGHHVAWTSVDGERWVLSEPAGAPTFWCDPPKELGHWEARSKAGLVRIADPYGDADVVELLQSAQ